MNSRASFFRYKSALIYFLVVFLGIMILFTGNSMASSSNVGKNPDQGPGYRSPDGCLDEGTMMNVVIFVTFVDTNGNLIKDSDGYGKYSNDFNVKITSTYPNSSQPNEGIWSPDLATRVASKTFSPNNQPQNYEQCSTSIANIPTFGGLNTASGSARALTFEGKGIEADSWKLSCGYSNLQGTPWNREFNIEGTGIPGGIPSGYTSAYPDGWDSPHRDARLFETFDLNKGSYTVVLRYTVTPLQTTVTPNTTSNVSNVNTGGSAIFTHTSSTTSFLAPNKLYRYNVWAWSDVVGPQLVQPDGNGNTGPSPAVVDGNNTKTLNTNSMLAPPGATYMCQNMQLVPNNPVALNLILGSPNPSTPVCVAINSPNTNRWLDSASRGGANVSVEPEQLTNSGRLWNSINRQATPQLAAKEWGYNHKATKAGYSNVNDVAVYTPGAYNTDYEYHHIDRYQSGTGGGECTHAFPLGNGNWQCDQWAPTYPIYACENNSCDYEDWFWWCTDNDAGTPRFMGRLRNAPGCMTKKERYPCNDPQYTGHYWSYGGANACPATYRCNWNGGYNEFVREGIPICEYRCDSGVGDYAPIGRASKLESNGTRNFETWGGSPDLNCYKPWQVTIRCNYSYIGSNWRSQEPNSGIPGFVDVTVNASDTGLDFDNLCAKNINYYGGFVGDTACAQITTTISPFQTNNASYLSPNQQTVPMSNSIWATRTTPNTATQCYQTIARPFVSFNKTDIRATGGYINAWGAWNGTSGYGTTVDYAIYATTWIDGVSSNKAAPSNTSPKSRTFANNDGSVWGGNFTSSMPSKYSQYVVTIGAGKTCTAIPGSITASQVINCAGTTATIGSNIDTGWTYASPKNLYIIADTINISGSVTSLNGVGLIARNINTCSDGVNNCASNLNITGFINSDSVRYGRAANTGGGSSFYCVRPGRPTDLPSWVARTCDRYTAASEIITYSPTFEISPAPYTPTNGPRSGKYDSIRALPPIY